MNMSALTRAIPLASGIWEGGETGGLGPSVIDRDVTWPLAAAICDGLRDTAGRSRSMRRRSLQASPGNPAHPQPRRTSRQATRRRRRTRAEARTYRVTEPLHAPVPVEGDESCEHGHRKIAPIHECRRWHGTDQRISGDATGRCRGEREYEHAVQVELLAHAQCRAARAASRGAQSPGDWWAPQRMLNCINNDAA